MTNRAFWTQGEVQAGRVLARPFPAEQEWSQTVLYPPDVVEARLRVGLIAGEDHLRWQIEVVNPQDGELLAMRSRPACRASDGLEELSSAFRHLLALLEAVTNPDPF